MGAEDELSSHRRRSVRKRPSPAQRLKGVGRVQTSIVVLGTTSRLLSALESSRRSHDPVPRDPNPRDIDADINSAPPHGVGHRERKRWQNPRSRALTGSTVSVHLVVLARTRQ